MTPTPILERLAQMLRLIVDIARLPVAELHFDSGMNHVDFPRIYRNFTGRHTRYKCIGSKTIGAALIDLRPFTAHADYLATVQGKGKAAAQSRKASARGYLLKRIDRNRYVDQIHDINISCEVRQGRPMDAVYRDKLAAYDAKPGFLYFGMFDKDDRLVAYCNVGLFGNFAGTEQVLGYKTSDGIMYLMFSEIVRHLIDTGGIAFFMYDTMLGGSAGMRDFKRRLGFRPFRVRYRLL